MCHKAIFFSIRALSTKFQKTRAEVKNFLRYPRQTWNVEAEQKNSPDDATRAEKKNA
jgi:hypothetical protein